MADSGGLFGLDPSLLANLGLGLMSAGAKNSPMRGNAAMGAMQGMQNYYGQQEAQQRLGMGKLQMQQLQQEMPMRMGYLKQLGTSLFSANNSDEVTGHLQGLMGAPGAQPPQGPPGGAAPQGALPQTAPAQQPPAQSQMGSGMPQSSADPMNLMKLGAFGGALGMPGAQGLQELGKTQLQYDPAVATRMEAAKSSVAVDQQQIQQALSSGNTQMAQAIAQKMRQDLGLLHIASMSGTQTRIGLNGDISTFNPNEGIQSTAGVESPIPGALQTRGALAAAEAQGKATGETVEVTGPDGAKYLVPKSTITGGARTGAPGAPGSGAPGSAPPGSMATLPPAKGTMLVGNAKQALESNQAYQTQAESSKDMLAATQTLMNSANDFTPGRFADSRGKFMEYANSFGLLSPEQAKALGSKQEGDKIAIQLQAAATKQLGSREAAQIFDKMGKSLPNLTLSQDGLAKVSSWMMGMSRYNIARADDANTKAQNNDATGVNNVRNTWIKNSNPLYYVMASAPPAAREELLSSMKNRADFVKQWQAAAKAGYAPRPGEYSGGP